MEKNVFYVTTPIYYVNSKPHMGHAYTTILADIITRYHSMIGDKTYFLTGTDEHGDKIQKVADKNNIDVQKLVDQNAIHFQNLLPIINIKNNDFIRTTEPRHKKEVQRFLQEVYDKGDIYFSDYSGKYCLGCERFLGDDDLIDGKCKDHQVEPEVIHEKNYFFRMSKYWDNLKKYVEENENFIQPSNFRNEVLGLLKQKPQDLCISRPKNRLTWGIELPFDKDFVAYVWFDALINYVSALKSQNNFEIFWPYVHHIIAKDILKPHCIYWPTMLMSIGLSLPKQIAIHGYWLIDENKMSKSIGKTVDPILYCEKYTSDSFRYFLARNMKFGRDASFSHEEFKNILNAELSNNLGNLYSRIVGLCRKNTENKVPKSYTYSNYEEQLKLSALSLKEKQKEAISSWALDTYIQNIIDFSTQVNKYIDEKKPWALAKIPEKKEELYTVLKISLESIRICFSFLYPIMPNISIKILEELGIKTDLNNINNSANTWELLEENHSFKDKITSIPRIEE